MKSISAHINEITTKRILLVEADHELSSQIQLNLQSLNLDVIPCSNLSEAKHHVNTQDFDLVLMERQLPDGEGLLLCMQLLEQQKEIPIMFLTNKGSEADIVLGLESGADDYLVKPFSVLELRARVKVLLRRFTKRTPTNDNYLQFADMYINTDTREVITNDQTINLTATEFDLLCYLAQHPQKVFSRMQLLEAVWGYSYSGYEHTVNSHINRLRAKLSHYFNEDIVKTVWGVGYKFTPPQIQAA
ncbi:response regulator transcription factor [Parashewanella curva]|uniref:response regulator transcription factor n=1 Tax=Parashewanella curva TaxID=2338552 RepID=UPI001FB3AE15|nr:response regulator transcription factor [Parashewanella curva]